MAKYRIFTVGFELPGDEFEYIEFNSDTTLLDADIVLFQPTLGSADTDEIHKGKPLLDEESSFTVKQHLDHWHSEIVAAVNAGKLVIVYLARSIDCYRYTGQSEYSGTGRSRVINNSVKEISSYDAVPSLKRVTPKSGSEIQIDKDAKFLAPYWSEFSDYSPYEMEIEGEFSQILLRSRSGNRMLGAAVRGKTGVLLFLPPLRYQEKAFIRRDKKSEQSYWTNKAFQFGKRLIATLCVLAANLKQQGQITPPPTWTAESKYRLASEARLETEIAKVSGNITSLQAKKSSLENDLEQVGSLRRLLFEQGKPLEAAILEALRLFGFDAQTFAEGESEFDSVFVSPEGRCLGEAEGKDNKAINIDKFSQLERNLQEDYARDEVTEYAKGALFGNGFRLLPISERGNFFTEKCVSAAKRVGVALVRTPDLFAPAKYLKEVLFDAEYAKRCRKAIFAASGDIVVFPEPPTTDTTVVGENAQADGAKSNIPFNADASPAGGVPTTQETTE